jgi:hypothetical protein
LDQLKGRSYEGKLTSRKKLEKFHSQDIESDKDSEEEHFDSEEGSHSENEGDFEAEVFGPSDEESEGEDEIEEDQVIETETTNGTSSVVVIAYYSK